MKYNLNRTMISNGVYFNNIRDTKFKTNRISINLFTQLDEKYAACNALIASILPKATAKIENMTQMSKLCDKMYGALLDAEVVKIGDYQMISFYIQTLDDQFALENEPLNRQGAELLCDVLLNPKLENNSFCQNIFDLEKQFLIDTIESEINDKRSYALSRLNKLMFAGEKFGIDRLGSLQSAKDITLESAMDAYKKLISTAHIEIMFTGSGCSSVAKEVFTDNFANINRENNVITTFVAPEQKPANVSEVKEQVDIYDVSQSKLAMGFRMGECSTKEQLTASKLMTALLGSTPTSRLFVYVREKLSLCYYCSAVFDKFKNVIFIDSGIEHENKQKAFDEILKQIDVLKNGEFDESELDKTKLYYKNSLNSITDSLSSIEYWYLNQILLGTSISPEDEIECIDNISRELIVNSAKGITLDSVYFLTGKVNV